MHASSEQLLCLEKSYIEMPRSAIQLIDPHCSHICGSKKSNRKWGIGAKAEKERTSSQPLIS